LIKNYSPICETGHRLLRFLDLLLRFDTPVEDWTISGLAKDVLVQTSLAALALHPQVAILFLVRFQFLLPFDVNVSHFVFASCTDHLLIRLQ